MAGKKDPSMKRVVTMLEKRLRQLERVGDPRSMPIFVEGKEVDFSSLKDIMMKYKHQGKLWHYVQAQESLMSTIEHSLFPRIRELKHGIQDDLSSLLGLLNAWEAFDAESFGGLHDLSENERKVLDIMKDENIEEKMKTTARIGETIGISQQQASNIQRTLKKKKLL